MIGEAGLVDIESLRSALAGAGDVLADDHLAPDLVGLIEEAGIPIRVPQWSAAALLSLAASAHGAGKTTPAPSLLPLYPREPEAVRLFEARETGF